MSRRAPTASLGRARRDPPPLDEGAL